MRQQDRKKWKKKKRGEDRELCYGELLLFWPSQLKPRRLCLLVCKAAAGAAEARTLGSWVEGKGGIGGSNNRLIKRRPLEGFSTGRGT